MNRRLFLKSGMAGLGMLVLPSLAATNSNASLGHVVIIGAGFGGATAARYLRMWSEGRIKVTLIELRPEFISCPVSNRILAGAADINTITHSYKTLRDLYGVSVIKGQASRIDPERKEVHVNEERIGYDRLIVATGIDFDYSRLPMLNAEIQATHIPHAWKAGPQTLLLKGQLRTLPDGGIVGITIPQVPYRCPPGPYERACQIAFYLKQHNPRAKLLVFDGNPAITSKRPLFERAWHELYPNIVEYLPSSGIENLDTTSLGLATTFGNYKLDVLNLIPPQTAGRLTLETGLASDARPWCDVNFLNYASGKIPGIHLLGDAVDAMTPKSAHIATSQAKVCASAIIAELAGEAVDPAPVFANTCYSFVDDKQAVHVANVYRYDAKDHDMRPAPGGGISAISSIVEGIHADIWAANIWADVLG
ncbi:NAD(P)/FAD-dependent oxidoreductase [Methylobacillus gramineus]|uniref:NAD(P)/FAD-dependent oxidoreductase n=1 Tax=Methylobacillus gramineus TaxID=755169 RepID=UPI001CFFE54E|nr:NAD(P)/FAD-dependent oxidoreductase [Methylobacillus gramineus]MCB5185307.1 NAD(P)/FAD-dependent oxidoreductase [Methylobacillus gramineus]